MRQRVLGYKRKHEDTSTLNDEQVEEVNNQKAYRTHLATLYLNNAMSAKRVKVQLQLAEKAGANGAEDLIRECLDAHAQRSMMRALVRGIALPEPYFAEVPCHDPTTGTDGVPQKIAFLLPHEMLHAFVKGDPGELAELVARPAGETQELKQSFCKAMHTPRTSRFH